ncbi:MAG: hypothetical protein RBT25_04740 [Lentisphaeria bacterium]|nr:hypothetical protein [Lentisphaeria bacterium]
MKTKPPVGWKLAPKKLQEQLDPKSPAKATTYTKEDDKRRRLVHYEYSLVDGYWKAIDSKTGRDARGETAEEALAVLAGWTLEKKVQYPKPDTEPDCEREYTRGDITLRVIDFAAGRVARCWIASDFTKTKASGWSARVALLALAEMHKTKAEEAEKEAHDTIF